MRKGTIIATLAAAGLLGTSAIAQTTAGGGVSASTPQGSVAGGATAGSMDHAPGKHKAKRHDRENRRDRATSNSATTYGSGTIYTDRDRATARRRRPSIVSERHAERPALSPGCLRVSAPRASRATTSHGRSPSSAWCS